MASLHALTRSTGRAYQGSGRIMVRAPRLKMSSVKHCLDRSLQLPDPHTNDLSPYPSTSSMAATHQPSGGLLLYKSQTIRSTGFYSPITPECALELVIGLRYAEILRSSSVQKEDDEGCMGGRQTCSSSSDCCLEVRNFRGSSLSAKDSRVARTAEYVTDAVACSIFLLLETEALVPQMLEAFSGRTGGQGGCTFSPVTPEHSPQMTVTKVEV
ncbi:hypothetical protein M406DRAFT_75691 [Cryphonectria parasitica EP155]|uniref:Uncharacterized protein n=1 Tax=Cryphonectria parasitica (strain ATCC 38755 / EP155) TaxID=660469 RepID=A0A9P4XSV4_CRYP1|nr:uncharacterized protein M406DRAFT_75691 [Cryphonectria parasitica EP155]KAF3760150.1 hypothetical protein M406DRAFT_75691 [Cryphonectria parasitica EP155]